MRVAQRYSRAGCAWAGARDTRAACSLGGRLADANHALPARRVVAHGPPGAPPRHAPGSTNHCRIFHTRGPCSAAACSSSSWLSRRKRAPWGCLASSPSTCQRGARVPESRQARGCCRAGTHKLGGICSVQPEDAAPACAAIEAGATNCGVCSLHNSDFPARTCWACT